MGPHGGQRRHTPGESEPHFILNESETHPRTRMSEYAPLRTAEDDGAEHEGARQAAGTPSRAALRERVEAAEARSAAARAEAARFDEAQQRGGRGPPDAPSSLEREQPEPEPEPEPMSLPLLPDTASQRCRSWCGSWRRWRPSTRRWKSRTPRWSSGWRR